MAFDATVAARLKEIVGRSGFTDDPAEIAPHLVEWRGKYHGRSPLLLKPQSADEISRVLAVCNDSRTPIVPQGGNTGLVGGQIPFTGEVLLSLSRMNRIRDVDAAGFSAIAEAGVVLDNMHAAADRACRYFPLQLASEGSCTIGGNISTNAGGEAVLRYGNTRSLVLGLEVVLAEGRVLDLLRTLRKDNTGYDLKQLFIGAEGTLGVITAAALRLFPKPEVHATAFAAAPNIGAALQLLALAQTETGGLLSAFEVLPRIGLEMVLKHIPQTRDPLPGPSPWYVLLEASGGANLHLKETLERALSTALESGTISDVVLAASNAQREAFWRLRNSLSEAQKHEGGSVKHDVSVPVSAIPAFLAKGVAAVEAIVPGVRPVPFGHLGDGNIHFNFSVPAGEDNARFLAKWNEVSRAVHDTVQQFGGSISAEHGIGVMKRDELPRYKTATELATMGAIKQMLDPNNILNPGKLIAA